MFLYVWLLGDMFNTIGVLFEQLPLPMLLINVWYAVMDGVLIGQVYYYRSRAKTLGMPYASVNSTYTTTDVMSSRDPMSAAAVPVEYAICKGLLQTLLTFVTASTMATTTLSRHRQCHHWDRWTKRRRC